MVNKGSLLIIRQSNDVHVMQTDSCYREAMVVGLPGALEGAIGQLSGEHPLCKSKQPFHLAAEFKDRATADA